MQRRRAAGIAIYDAMLEASPTNSDALLGRGPCVRVDEALPRSRARLTAATQASPGYTGTWIALGSPYMWSGRPAQAIAPYTLDGIAWPDDPDAALARGRAHRAAGDVAAARVTSRRPARGAGDTEVQRLKNDLSRNGRVLTAHRRRLPLGAAGRGGPYLLQWRRGLERCRGLAAAALREGFAGTGGLERGSLQSSGFGLGTGWLCVVVAAGLCERPLPAGPDRGILPRNACRTIPGRGSRLGVVGEHRPPPLRHQQRVLRNCGVGRYVGNWYLRYKLQHVPGEASGSWSHRVHRAELLPGQCADDYGS